MKKIIALVAAIAALALLCCSCGSEKATAKVIDIQLTSEEYAFAVNPNNAELYEKVNAFLKEIKDNGKFDEVCCSSLSSEQSPPPKRTAPRIS